jgi:hypothetical protein
MLQIVFVMPVTRKLADQQAKQAQGMPGMDWLGNAMQGLMGVGLIVSLVLTFVIWLTVFFLLKSNSARDAFEGKPPAEPAAEAAAGAKQPSAYEGYEDDYGSSPKPPETGISDRSH